MPAAREALLLQRKRQSPWSSQGGMRVSTNLPGVMLRWFAGKCALMCTRGRGQVQREFLVRKQSSRMVLASGSFTQENLDGGLVSIVYLSWVEVTLPVPHRHQAPVLVAQVSPRFKSRALKHQSSDTEGEPLWWQPTGTVMAFDIWFCFTLQIT